MSSSKPEDTWKQKRDSGSTQEKKKQRLDATSARGRVDSKTDTETSISTGAGVDTDDKLRLANV